jgi:peptide/nickel transport system substrate-binding protein
MRTRILLLAALATLAAVLAAGCGGSGDEASPPPSQEPAPPSEQPATSGEDSESPAEEPPPPGQEGEIEQGGVARIGTMGEIDSLNPFVGFNAESYISWIMTYPMLVQMNSDLKIEGDWADSWDVSEDGKIWTFHLKPGGMWSDGTPLTAEDAVWMGNTTIKYGDGATNSMYTYVLGATSFEAPDENTLVITFEQAPPEGKLLEGLTQYPILPKHVWEQFDTGKGKDLKTFNPQDELPLVSAGPFILTEFDKKGASIYERNPGFYGPEPYVDAVGYQHFENEDAMLQALQTGDLDYVEEVPFRAVETLQGNNDLAVEIVKGSQINNFIFNSNPNKPGNRELLDPKVREAFAHAINRDEIADVVYAGLAKPTASIIAPYSGEWMNPNLKPETFDIDVANKILDDAGYERGSDGTRVDQDGEKMEYEVILPQGLLGVQREFEVVQRGLAEIGIKVTPAVYDDTTAFEKVGEPDYTYKVFDLAMWDWIGLYDPDFILSVVTCDQWGYGDTGYCNPEYDRLYKEQSLEIDPEKRKEIVWALQEKLYNERPYIQLVVLDVVTARRADWASFQPLLAGYSKRPWTEAHKVS